MKKFFLAFAIIAIAFSADAQKTSGSSTGTKFGGGLRLALPLGDFGDGYNFGIGAELQAEHMFTENVAGTFTTGYTNFIGESIGSFKIPSVGYIPILAGVRVYPSPNFFIGGKLGYGILTGSGDSEGAFNYEPQIGFNGQKFQLALGYNGLSKNSSTLSHLGLSAIYKFN